MTPIPQPSAMQFDFSDADFRFLAGLANRKTGIVLADNKRDMLYGRLVRRLRSLNLDSFHDYCALLQTEAGEEEMPHLVNAVTTNLTAFFREGHHFEHLAQQAQAWGPRARIWSAGCSSGMEPYSIAMTLHDALGGMRGRDVKILATDIDSNMVNTGAKGEYNASDFDKAPATAQGYLEPAGPNRVRIAAPIREMVSFKPLNLLEDWPMRGPFDAVFCRNVVIYFDKPTKEALFERMAELIAPNGWLYIGHSENLNGITDRFQLVGRTIYRRVR